MISGKVLIFAAGALVGAGAVCFAKSDMAKRVALTLAAKGLELKDNVAKASERAKEAAEDFMAEARYGREEKGNI